MSEGAGTLSRMDIADRSASSFDDGAGSERVWRGAGPKPWWFDDPEIAAARQRVLDEFCCEPDEPAGSEEPKSDENNEPGVPAGDTDDKSASSFDDAVESERVWTGTGPKPWWFDDPVIAAARRRVLDEIESAPVRSDYIEPDRVLNDMLSGGSVRELREAREDLARAQARYADAVRSGRECGLSWGEVGTVLGVPRQLLHRRFARRLMSRRGTSER